MGRKINLKFTLQFAITGAISFSIPVYFFIRESMYSKTWLLFLGVFLFFIVTVIHTLVNGNRRGEPGTPVELIFESELITITAIILCCVISFILLVIFVPGYLGNGPAQKVLTGNPPSDVLDKTNGLSLKIFMTAIIGNFSVGSFASILLPFYSTGRRRRDSAGEEPFV